jgi:hypothetical protein
MNFIQRILCKIAARTPHKEKEPQPELSEKELKERGGYIIPNPYAQCGFLPERDDFDSYEDWKNYKRGRW